MTKLCPSTTTFLAFMVPADIGQSRGVASHTTIAKARMISAAAPIETAKTVFINSLGSFQLLAERHLTQGALSFTQIFTNTLARSTSMLRIATFQAMEPDVFLMRD